MPTARKLQPHLFHANRLNWHLQGVGGESQQPRPQDSRLTHCNMVPISILCCDALELRVVQDSHQWRVGAVYVTCYSTAARSSHCVPLDDNIWYYQFGRVFDLISNWFENLYIKPSPNGPSPFHAWICSVSAFIQNPAILAFSLKCNQVLWWGTVGKDFPEFRSLVPFTRDLMQASLLNISAVDCMSKRGTLCRTTFSTCSVT